MSKLICISDIHINTYSAFEFYPGFRNDQFVKAANRVNEIGRENSCTDLAILGDLIDSPIVRPKTLHILKDFITTLASHYKNIYYILGQHDCDSKSSEWKYDDSVVNIFNDFHAMKYMNKQSLNIDGKNLYFHDWCSEDMSEEIPEGTNIILTHFGISTLFGQEIDDTKFELMIAGDIHAPIDLGKLHSVGGFLQKDLKDTPYGSAVVLDIDNMTFERVHLINDRYKFLRIYNEGTEEDKDEFTWIIPSTDRISNVELNQGSKKYNVDLNNLSEIVLDCIKSEGLMDIHKQYLDKITLSPVVDFNFKLIELEITNFRSIEYFKYNFEKNSGNIYVSGPNGSGKTSFVNALFTALAGDRRISKYITRDKDFVEVAVSFYYQNILFKIVRRNGKTEFYENGSQIFKNNKTALDNYIYERLPFLNYISVFYIRAKSNYFYNFFNSGLLTRLFNLDELEEYASLAGQDWNEINGQVNSLTEEKLKLEGSLSVLESEVDLLKSQIEEIPEINESESDISNRRKHISELSYKIKQDRISITNFQSKSVPEKVDHTELDNKLLSLKGQLKPYIRLDELKGNLKSLELKLSRINDSNVECPNCKTKFSLTFSKSEIDKIESDIKSTKIEIESLSSELTSTRQEIESQISQTSKKISEISRLNSDYSIYMFEKSKIEKLTSDLVDLETELSKTLGNSSLDDYITNLDKLISNISIRSKMKSSIDSKLDSISNCKSKINDLIKKIEETTKSRDEISRYIQYFDNSSENSIYRQLVIKISESLSDNELSFTNQNTDEENLGFQLKVGNYWMNYEDLSEGQKTYSDLKLLNKLFSLMNGAGLLILDEFTSTIDRDSIEKIINMIKSMKCNVLINISHNAFLNADFDHKINFRLEGNKSIIQEM